MRHPIQFVGLLALGIALSACGNDSDSAFGPGQQPPGGNPGTPPPTWVQPITPPSLIVQPNPGSNLVAGTGNAYEVPAYSSDSDYTIHLWNSYHRIAESSNIGTLNVQNERVRVDIMAPSNFQQINMPQSYGYLGFFQHRSPPHTNIHTFSQINVSGSYNILDLSSASLQYISTSRITVSGLHNQIIMPCHFNNLHLIDMTRQPNSVRTQCY